MPSACAIRALPDFLINQIKAGEIVERPAHVVKELVENALDAQAQKVDIEIAHAGIDLIAIQDDGHGMAKDELPLAFHRHHTSKIQKFDDLFRLSSFGFRGEALPSIASVSRLRCQSVPREGEGGLIEFEGGEQVTFSAARAAHSGTSFVVRDLFYQTPVRLKFVRSQALEKKAIKHFLNGFFLSRPDVAFSLKWDKNERQQLRPTEDFQKRVEQVFRTSLKSFTAQEQIHQIEGEYEGLQARLFYWMGAKKAQASHQFTFINGRLVQERSWHHALVQGAQDHAPFAELSAYCLLLQAPSAEVDVNVHPHKTQVKLEKPGQLYALLRSLFQKTAPSPSPKPSQAQRERPSQADDKQEHGALNTHPLQVQSESAIWEIEKGFFCFQKLAPCSPQEHTWLIDAGHLTRGLLEQIFLAKKVRADALLVSAPFPGHFNSQLCEFLRSFGLEIDALDAETLALRAAPGPLLGLNTTVFAQTFYHELAACPPGQWEERGSAALKTALIATGRASSAAAIQQLADQIDWQGPLAAPPTAKVLDSSTLKALLHS